MDQDHWGHDTLVEQSGAPVAKPAVIESPIAAIEVGKGGTCAVAAEASTISTPTTSTISAR